MKTVQFLIAVLMIAGAGPWSSAWAQIDYCKLSDEKHEIHLFGETYSAKPDRSQMLRGLDKISKEFAMGDEVKIIVHGNGANKILKVCVPGCPDKGLLGNLIDAECSAQVAKKDMVGFKKKYISSVKTALSSAGNEYDLFGHFRALEAYYQGRSTGETNVYVFNTTVPFGYDASNSASLDKIFVETVQANNQAGITLPKLSFVNPNQSKDLMNFWSDLELDGNSDGFKLDITKVVLD